jgi:hypothetical protein
MGMDGQDREQRKSFGSPWRTGTAGEFYMDEQDAQDNGKKHKTKNRGSSTSLKRHEGNSTWMGKIYRIKPRENAYFWPQIDAD